MGKPRVVLIPGLLGTALRDSTKDAESARKFARQHWDKIKPKATLLEMGGNELVGEDSDLVWGRFQCLHWLGDQPGWMEFLALGDGYDDGGPIRTKSFTDLVVKWGKFKPPTEIRPYKSLVELLSGKSELLVFSYDWRLRAAVAAQALQMAVLMKWFGGSRPKRQLAESEKVLLIGHSLGGLVARLFVEDPAYLGSKVVRHAMMVGTPNKGAPTAFGYFTGTLGPKDVKPVEKTLQAIAAGVRANSPNAPLAENEITPEQLKKLVQSLASIIQLFPTYDFLYLDSRGKKKESYADTYKNSKNDDKRHRKTKKLTLDVLRELSQKLREGLSLDAWLARFGITYDFVGSTDRPTYVAMMNDRQSKSGYAMKPDRAGDGTVPTFSSLDWIRNDKSLRTVSTREVTPGSKAEHGELCNHHEVQRLSVERLTKRPGIKQGPPGRLVRGNIEQYEAIARDVFLAKREPFADLKDKRTKVVCYALITGVDPKKPLIDIEKKKVGKRVDLKNPPKGLMWPTVWPGRSGKTLYEFVVLAASSETNTPGGVLFLPHSNEGFLHLFGIVGAPAFDPCDNKGHAEMQIKHWLEAQRRERRWRTSVESIDMWNESLTGDEGFSPCSLCCGDLASMWRPDSLKRLTMNWNALFTGREACKRDTTDESLGLMRKTGWDLFGPMPAPPKPKTA